MPLDAIRNKIEVFEKSKDTEAEEVRRRAIEIESQRAKARAEELGPRISKLPVEEQLKEMDIRITEKLGEFAGPSEADIETTSVESVVGAVESALSLSSGMLTWGAGKVFAAGPRLVGDTEEAERIESIVNDLAYKPYTETGRKLVSGISHGIETMLIPVRMWGEAIDESIIKPLEGKSEHAKAKRFFESFNHVVYFIFTDCNSIAFDFLICQFTIDEVIKNVLANLKECLTLFFRRVI